MDAIYVAGRDAVFPLLSALTTSGTSSPFT